jgi:predicted nuclease of predicted toxin-antitoxin system
MSIKVLIDMNLSPEWVSVFEQRGWSALHWSDVGDPKADDRIILSWAAQHGYTVFTQDLDFSAILASTRAAAPSVIQLRSQDVLPDRFANTVIAAIHQFEPLLRRGALIVIDLKRSRARILPLIQSQN